MRDVVSIHMLKFCRITFEQQRGISIFILLKTFHAYLPAPGIFITCVGVARSYWILRLSGMVTRVGHAG
jgi:hypothetical protein